MLIGFFGFILTLLVIALVIAVLFWALNLASGAIGIPPNIVQIMKAIIAILALIWLLGALFGALPAVPMWRAVR